MEETMFHYQKKVLAVAVIATLGLPAGVQADTVTMSWSGAFTMLGANGRFISNSGTTSNPYASSCDPGTNCRLALTGMLTFDTVTGAGSGTMVPFSWFGQGNAVFTSISLQKIGDGAGGPGSLVLGNMLWNWNISNGIPTSIVWDASGLMSAINGGLSVGQIISGGALPASDNTEIDTDGIPGSTTYPIGPALLSTTVWNTTNIVTPTTLGTNPSGTLPLITETNHGVLLKDITNGDVGIGGSPNQTFPFVGANINIDILSAQVTSIEAVPIPATLWLFGSGLAGLIGVARHKRRYAEKQHDA
jgi:hypothetical protein